MKKLFQTATRSMFKSIAEDASLIDESQNEILVRVVESNEIVDFSNQFPAMVVAKKKSFIIENPDDFEIKNDNRLIVDGVSWKIVEILKDDGYTTQVLVR